VQISLYLRLEILLSMLTDQHRRLSWGEGSQPQQNKDLATTDLPLNSDNLDQIAKFTRKGLNAKEMVTLSGIYELRNMLTD
jgi:Peroxidase